MRLLVRVAAALAVGGVTVAAATPASAQFFLKSRDISGAPVQGDEPGIAQALPGATPAELRANLVWTMRAALNVAALQCDFQPTLLTVPNYNALLHDHDGELASSWTVLGKYFTRVNGKSAAKGQSALDHFQTVTYSSFSAITAQYTFCLTASRIGRDALFTPRGEFGAFAASRMRELRNSFTPWGDQTALRYIEYGMAALPRLDAACWSKKGEWVEKKCGAQNWPPVGAGYAAR